MHHHKRLLAGVDNEMFRDSFVRNWLKQLNPIAEEVLLDIGAGNMPYKHDVESAGLRYVSHDFELYSGNTSYPGLQSRDWTTTGHSLKCDITELPADYADFFLCTEVLEHVPDPARALFAISSASKVGALGLVTVPLLSRMHQAPFFFSAGLSPYWFQYHAPRAGLEIIDIVVVGDFVDLMHQEIPHLFSGLRLASLVKWMYARLTPVFRALCNQETLESGGFSVYVTLKKTG
jgi:hypothetical protein